MDADLSKACWRAGAKLLVGFAVIGAVVGIRIVTAKPTGIDAELAELERFEAEQAAAASAPSATASATAPESDGVAGDESSVPTPMAATGDVVSSDPDRMVRCHLAGPVQFMRAADCGIRGGRVEELPPPEPEDPTATRTTP